MIQIIDDSGLEWYEVDAKYQLKLGWPLVRRRLSLKDEDTNNVGEKIFSLDPIEEAISVHLKNQQSVDHVHHLHIRPATSNYVKCEVIHSFRVSYSTLRQLKHIPVFDSILNRVLSIWEGCDYIVLDSFEITKVRA